MNVKSGNANGMMYTAPILLITGSPGTGKSWRTNKEGMDNLAKYNRLYETSKALTYVLYHDDYPVSRITNFWNDTEGAYQASGLSRCY